MLVCKRTPKELAEVHIGKARQTGRTYALVASLPANSDYVVLVHKREFAKYLKEIIEHERGISVCRRGLFVTSLDQLKGWDAPVYVDNCVLDMMAINFVAGLNAK